MKKARLIEAVQIKPVSGSRNPATFPPMIFAIRSVSLALGITALLVCTGPVAAEDLATALAAGHVSVSFRGNGGSSGDSIEVVVAKTARAGPGALSLTIARGTRLQSRKASDQSMVVAGVRGRTLGGDSYEPASAIIVSEKGSTTYVLEAYCMDFEKDNPSSNTAFTITAPDPVLAAILGEVVSLSTVAKQAAVWIYTDRATFAHVNAKFTVSKAEWAAAEAAVKKCHALAKQAPATGKKPDAPRKNSAK